jgi:hypothetical protein
MHAYEGDHYNRGSRSQPARHAGACAAERRRPRGVLDTLGGLLGGGSRTLRGTVVVSDGSTVVLRTDDRSTYRVDVASLDPSSRTSLAPGQTVTVTARGGAGDVLTATQIQADANATSATTFQRLSGTVQESGKQRILFKTGDDLVVPVDVSRVHGLPYLAANQPATLYYEQGPKQEIQAVWLEPGSTQPSASPSPAGQSLQGKVETIGVSTLTLQTSDGKTVTVDTTAVDQHAVASVRPGDAVTVTGTATSDSGRFQAETVRSNR